AAAASTTTTAPAATTTATHGRGRGVSLRRCRGGLLGGLLFRLLLIIRHSSLVRRAALPRTAVSKGHA
ncbi:MAG: hypothetical protein JWO87_2297, partial [Phycisphaerales bacterium]|nr:hypothetical protein [Phycisphaerales bacterium]